MLQLDQKAKKQFIIEWLYILCSGILSHECSSRTGSVTPSVRPSLRSTFSQLCSTSLSFGQEGSSGFKWFEVVWSGVKWDQPAYISSLCIINLKYVNCSCTSRKYYLFVLNWIYTNRVTKYFHPIANINNILPVHSISNH